MKTNAYPNYDWHTNMMPSRDLTKWMQAVREIYYSVHKGAKREDAFDKITNGWGKMEKLDFKNWLKFYEENGQNKYKEATVKTAQFWNELPRFDNHPAIDMERVKAPETHPDVLKEERKQLIETQRQKIISRLDSAEKLMRATEFDGPETPQLIEILHQLKQKIYMVNKISTSIRLYQDMIVREASILKKDGFKEASIFLIKMAQELPSVVEPSNPIQIGDGQAGTLPGQAPGQVSPPSGDIPIDVSVPQQLPGTPANAAPPDASTPLQQPALPQQEPMSEGLKNFLEGLETGNTSTEDDSQEDEGKDDDNSFIAEAQMAPPTQDPNALLEVDEEPISADPEVKAGKDFDQLLDQTFANITVADVVSKLEDVAKIFKTREIPRQLAMIDMMLDRLGLAPFFSELSEASQKSLESNNYMQTRVESVLSKLRGTVETKALDLKNYDAPPPSPVANQLQEEDEKEKARKKMRKEIEQQNLEKPKPEIEVQEDLGQPAELQSATPPTPTPAPTPPAIPAP